MPRYNGPYIDYVNVPAPPPGPNVAPTAAYAIYVDFKTRLESCIQTIENLDYYGIGLVGGLSTFCMAGFGAVMTALTTAEYKTASIAVSAVSTGVGAALAFAITMCKNAKEQSIETLESLLTSGTGTTYVSQAAREKLLQVYQGTATLNASSVSSGKYVAMCTGVPAAVPAAPASSASSAASAGDPPVLAPAPFHSVFWNGPLRPTEAAAQVDLQEHLDASHPHAAGAHVAIDSTMCFVRPFATV